MLTESHTLHFSNSHRLRFQPPALSKPCLFLSSGSTTAGKPWFCLSISGQRPAPSNQSYMNYILICISIQMYQNCTIWKTHLRKTDQIKNLSGNFIKDRVLFYLRVAQFKLLPESMSPSLTHFMFK